MAEYLTLYDTIHGTHAPAFRAAACTLAADSTGFSPMDEAQKAKEPTTREQPAQSSRRPWHAPQFFVAEFANTLTQGQAQSDGAAQAPSSS
jgi:hypothetical protein